MNKNFKVGDKVKCTWGEDKGKIFIVHKIIYNAYSCKLADESNNKRYRYNDNTLRRI